MKIKLPKTKYIYGSILLIALVILSCAVVTSQTHTAQAKFFNNIGANGYCDDDDASPRGEAESGQGAEGGGCLLSNWVQIPEEYRPSKDEFLQQSIACENDPSSTDGGACMNALRSCYTLMLDKNNCKNPSLVARMGDECGYIGGITGATGGEIDSGDDCNALSEANNDSISRMEDDYRNKLKSCEKKEIGTERNNCYDKFNHAIAECAARAGLGTKDHNSRDGFDGAPLGPIETNDGGYNSLDMNQQQYKDCLDEETRKNSDEDMCKDVGGAWKNNKCSRYSDFTNKESCIAAGGRFVLRDQKNEDDPNDDQWECTDPNNLKCEDNSIPDEDNKCADGKDPALVTDDTTPNTTVNAHKKEDFETCGEAGVNLLSCSEKDCPGSTGPFSGVQVLGCVLRIGLQALTVLVGIGSVGGIAYSAFRYAGASDNAGAVSEAKNRIRDIVIGLIVYVFLLAVVQWLVPGLVMDTGASSSGTATTQASP